MSKSIIIATRKGTFVAELDRTRSLTLSGHSGVCVNYASVDPNTGTLWAALGFGHWGAKLSRSDDAGRSWRDAAQIKYPAGSRYLASPDPGEEGEGEERFTLRDATLLKLWVIAFGAPGQVYVGTIPGGLFESSDNGECFSLNLPLWNHESRGGDLFTGSGNGKTHWFGTPASEGEFAPGLHSIDVDKSNPARLRVAISTAGVLETEDGGKTWQGRNAGLTNDYLPDTQAEWGHDVHFLKSCPAQPDHVWQQNHCGVFHSKDGCKSWTKVSQPSQGVHFGFPIATDDHDGSTAWVVPGISDQKRMTIDGSLFVARTQDGGQAWQQLRAGLPQNNAYDVVYRHALDVSGDAVAFGSTTGNLYLSENRGETWQVLAHNLPPIYSVRFG